jgi:predicted ArsR family transcriptional regulator
MIQHLNTPQTIKQVAEKMGMKPHALYHHVKVLLGCGVVELVRHEKLKGSIEKKYYQLTSEYRKPIEAAPVEGNEIIVFAKQILDEYQGDIESGLDLPAHAHKSLVTVRAEDVKEIQRRLNEGMEKLVETCLKPFDNPDGDTVFILNTFGFLK